MSSYELDLRGVACPMNFVKTRLFLDKMGSGEEVLVTLDEGEPLESVTSSVRAEGHEVGEPRPVCQGVFAISIRKA